MVIPNEVAEVLKDPDEIALTLGKASRVDGIIVPKPGMDLLHTTQSSDQSDDKIDPNRLKRTSAFLVNKSDATSYAGYNLLRETSGSNLKKGLLATKMREAVLEDDDAVLIDDNSSNDSNKKHRWGKIGNGRPDVVFFQDPDALAELRKIKEEQHQRRILAESRNSTIENEVTNTRLRKELREMRKNRSRKDCYTLVHENLHLNPFMTKILRSNDFTPSAGVTHKDNVLLPNSPSCSGGDFKSPKSNMMSRAEFEMRTSLTILKSMGPEPEKRKRNNRVT